MTRPSVLTLKLAVPLASFSKIPSPLRTHTRPCAHSKSSTSPPTSPSISSPAPPCSCQRCHPRCVKQPRPAVPSAAHLRVYPLLLWLGLSLLNPLVLRHCQQRLGLSSITPFVTSRPAYPLVSTDIHFSFVITCARLAIKTLEESISRMLFPLLSLCNSLEFFTVSSTCAIFRR
ncbi:hypothetical protein BJV78DRAFT_237394 [Lactifluus subvellereus]|nr:hypothetical protein BJV78DRAFT_237394 [Lactifluus subvellereus]